MRKDLLATNRQKKILRLFQIEFGPDITTGGAGWEIDRLFSNDDIREKWRRYVFCTNDFDVDTDELRPFDGDQLENVIIPEDWHSSELTKSFLHELVDDIFVNESPFDSPEPSLAFSNKTFSFTGKFGRGNRKSCETAVETLGAQTANKVNSRVDFLVIGEAGSTSYKYGEYGTKIEHAILLRREHGMPAIVSEKHFESEMAAQSNGEYAG